MRKLIFTLLLLTSGCLPLSAGTVPPTLLPTQTLSPTEIPAPTATVPEPPPVPVIPRLTEDTLKNATYTLPVYEQTVTLQDGTYHTGEGPSQLSVRLLDPVVFGDLDGDNQDDAVLLLAENGGGSGVFVSLLVILNQNGQPLQSGVTLIDDRPQIQNLHLENGLITLEAVIHGTNDPGCCPNFLVSATYRWADTLTLVHFTSQTPDGSPRVITLAPPPDPTATPFHLIGTVTIAPFENTLVYQLTDMAGNVLSEGPVQVLSEEMGGPGTFDTPLDLSTYPSPLRLTVQDLSTADGSILALDTLFLER